MKDESIIGGLPSSAVTPRPPAGAAVPSPETDADIRLAALERVRDRALQMVTAVRLYVEDGRIKESGTVARYARKLANELEAADSNETPKVELPPAHTGRWPDDAPAKPSDARYDVLCSFCGLRTGSHTREQAAACVDRWLAILEPGEDEGLAETTRHAEQEYPGPNPGTKDHAHPGVDAGAGQFLMRCDECGWTGRRDRLDDALAGVHPSCPYLASAELADESSPDFAGDPCICGHLRNHHHREGFQSCWECDCESFAITVPTLMGGRMTLEQERADHEVLLCIGHEMEQQDAKHPSGYTSDRDGVRLGIASAEDELREALAAWDEEKRGGRWTQTRAELMQVLGVVARLVREIDKDARERDGI